MKELKPPRPVSSQDLAKQLAEATDVHLREARFSLDIMVRLLRDHLMAGRSVKLTGFGLLRVSPIQSEVINRRNGSNEITRKVAIKFDPHPRFFDDD